MHPTRIDIPEDKRIAITRLLNDRLADAIDLKTQAKQAHWNVKGPNFIALHELFDKISEDIDEQVDELAERVTTLGGVAEGTIRAVAARSRLPEYPLHIKSGLDHVQALANSLASFGKAVRAAIDQSTELGDANTADLFTGISRDTDKNLWFVEAHLQADR
jgi:starvation-inducible DNA-binding protein